MRRDPARRVGDAALPQRPAARRRLPRDRRRARGRGPDLLADGEIIAFKGGATSFEQLQQRIGISDPERARHSRVKVYYYIFDLLELGGEDLRPLPLLERKARLRKAIDFDGGHLRYVSYRRARA